MQAWMVFTIESLVAFLLVITIGYCFSLNRKLKKLRADEAMIKATIVELFSATEGAERAIRQLKSTVVDCDRSLTGKLGEARGLMEGLDGRIRDGGAVVQQIGQIVQAAKREPMQDADALHVVPVSALSPVDPALADDKKDLSKAAAAARALAQRLSLFSRGQAA